MPTFLQIIIRKKMEKKKEMEKELKNKN